MSQLSLTKMKMNNIIIEENSTTTIVEMEPWVPGPPWSTTWEDIEDKPATFPPSTHNHDGVYSKLIWWNIFTFI